MPTRADRFPRYRCGFFRISLLTSYVRGSEFTESLTLVQSAGPQTFELRNLVYRAFALLRSQTANRSHFIAVRFSGLVTAAHKAMQPIVLLYLGCALRFIELLPFILTSD